MEPNRYTISPSNGQGGKAGRGRNKTATVRVLERLRAGEYLLKAQFRYTVADSASEAKAHAKAVDWVDVARAAIAKAEGTQ